MSNISKIAVRGAAVLAATAASGGLLIASLALPAGAARRDTNVANTSADPVCTRTRIDHCQQVAQSPRPDARREAALVRHAQESAS